MRHIGNVEDPTLATSAALILLGDGIRTELRDEGEGVEVWVESDARIDDAKQQLAAFLANPADASWRAARDAGAARLAEAKALNDRYQRRVKQAAVSIDGANERGWFSISILVIAAAVAAISQFGSDLDAISGLFLTNYPSWNRLPEVRAGEVWRIFTPILVHFGPMHLLFNGFMWWQIGQQLESRKGVAFFAPMVIVTAAATNLGQFAWYLWTDPLRVNAVGGLSGVLYAMFGYAWIKGRIDPADRIGVDPRTVNQMLIWLVVCMTGLVGPIANGAHVMGLIAGVLWAYGEVAYFNWSKRR